MRKIEKFNNFNLIKNMKLSHFTGWNSETNTVGNNVKLKKAALDGYHLSNKLEFVKFILEIDENNTLQVYVGNEDKNHIESRYTKEQINKWCEEIKEDTLRGGLDFKPADRKLGYVYDDTSELYLIDENGKVV